MRQIALKTRKDNVRCGLRLREGDAGLEAPNQCEGISPIAHIVKNGGDEEVGIRTRGENGTEIERGRQDADDGYRTIVESDGLADNGGASGQLTAPEGVSENRNGAGIFQALVGSER